MAFNTIGKILTTAVTLLSLFLCFLPNLNLLWKTIIFLALVCILLIILYANQIVKNKKAIKTLQKVSNNHKALSSQFDEQQISLKKYKDCFNLIGKAFLLANLNTNDEKVNFLYDIYLHIQSELIGGNKND